MTDYDRRHVSIYVRLLDAETQAANWREAARLVLGLDPALDYAGAKRVHSTHLTRAHWLAAHGYREVRRE